ncbi:MAG: MIP/aquaporin family protein [Thermoplasmatota archaeon]
MAFMDRTLNAKLAAEAVGTFTLVYVGVMVLTVGADSGLVGAALAHGLAIAVMASATMTISGGHLNPAVTVGVWAARRIPGSEAISYILAQLGGGALGALLARFSLPEGLYVNQGLPGVDASITPLTAIVIEAVLTFFLVFVVFGTGVDARFGARVGGLAIGIAVTMDILAGGHLTGAAMNPARWFGPALVTKDWTNALVYVVGPLLGAVLASGLWTSLLLPVAGRRTPTEPSP